MNQASFNDLTKFLVFHILSFLSLDELAKVALVNKSLNSVVKFTLEQMTLELENGSKRNLLEKIKSFLTNAPVGFSQFKLLFVKTQSALIFKIQKGDNDAVSSFAKHQHTELITGVTQTGLFYSPKEGKAELENGNCDHVLFVDTKNPHNYFHLTAYYTTNKNLEDINTKTAFKEDPYCGKKKKWLFSPFISNVENPPQAYVEEFKKTEIWEQLFLKKENK